MAAGAGDLTTRWLLGGGSLLHNLSGLAPSPAHPTPPSHPHPTPCQLQDPHHVHHRVYIASLAAAAAGHTATAGTTTVVSGTGSSLRVSHVLTHTDVVRLLWEKREALGELAAKTVEELELDAVSGRGAAHELLIVLTVVCWSFLLIGLCCWFLDLLACPALVP